MTAAWALLRAIPVSVWLGAAIIAALAVYHVSEVRQAREQTRLELKAAIEAEAAKTGRQADAATRDVLACTGTWNRETGRCVP